METKLHAPRPSQTHRLQEASNQAAACPAHSTMNQHTNSSEYHAKHLRSTGRDAHAPARADRSCAMSACYRTAVVGNTQLTARWCFVEVVAAAALPDKPRAATAGLAKAQPARGARSQKPFSKQVFRPCCLLFLCLSLVCVRVCVRVWACACACVCFVSPCLCSLLLPAWRLRVLSQRMQCRG